MSLPFFIGCLLFFQFRLTGFPDNQCQFAEMERLHLHTIQQLQRELADARERSGTFTDDSHISHNNSKDATQFAPNNGNQLAANGGALSGNTGILPNGNSDSAESFASSGNASTQVVLLVVSSFIFYCFSIVIVLKVLEGSFLKTFLGWRL